MTWPTAASPPATHDVLLATSPADGTQLARTPNEVTLTFDQPALGVGTAIVVNGPSGAVQSGKPELVDRQVRQPLLPGSPAGRYHVLWRVTSSDGHPVSGEFTFTSAAASTGQSARPAPTGPRTSTGAGPAPQDGGGALSPAAVAALGFVLLVATSVTVVWRRRRGRRT